MTGIWLPELGRRQWGASTKLVQSAEKARDELVALYGELLGYSSLAVARAMATLTSTLLTLVPMFAPAWTKCGGNYCRALQLLPRVVLSTLFGFHTPKCSCSAFAQPC